MPETGSTLARPLQDGYFEVLLPAGLIGVEHSNLTVAWVDFYR